MLRLILLSLFKHPRQFVFNFGEDRLSFVSHLEMLCIEPLWVKLGGFVLEVALEQVREAHLHEVSLEVPDQPTVQLIVSFAVVVESIEYLVDVPHALFHFFLYLLDDALHIDLVVMSELFRFLAQSL